jgi:hypothetical protein
MSTDSIEACLNVWCIIDEGTGIVYRIAARAYALDGSDSVKADVLKRLASTDFHLACELSVLSKYETTIVDETGREQTVHGLFPRHVHTVFPDMLDRICKELEREFPARPVADVKNPRAYRLKFDAAPYYVLTFLIENAEGELSAVSI